MSESVQGTLPAIMTRSWKGDLHCVLVFTSSRIIVSVKGLLAQAAASGVFGGAGAGVGLVGAALGAAVGGATIGADRSKDLGRYSPDAILQANKKNYEILYSRILKIETGRKLGTNRLYIYDHEKVHKFKFQATKIEQVEDALRRFVPGNMMVQRVDKLD